MPNECMSSLLKARYVRIAGLTLGAVAIGLGAIAITASASGMTFGARTSNASNSAPQQADTTAAVLDASSSSAVCTAFMKHFAVEVGKTQAQINAAFQKAIADTLADEVKSGQISQAQADATKKKLANQTPCTMPTVHKPSGKEISAYMQQYVSAAASALGLTDAQLKSDLASGQSLSQIAAAKHITEADFRTKLIAKLKPTLDAAVTSKALTAAQEQAIVNRLQTGTLPLWHAKKTKPASGARERD